MRPDASVKALFDALSAEDFFESTALGSFEPGAAGEHSARNAIWVAEFCAVPLRSTRSGAPRVGDATLVATLRGVHHSRIVNDLDPVPQLPPVLARLSGVPVYQHGGELHHIRPDGRIEVCRPRIETAGHPKLSGGTLGALDAARRLVGGTAAKLKATLDGAWQGHLHESLSDHAPVDYAYRLERALLAGVTGSVGAVEGGEP